MKQLYYPLILSIFLLSGCVPPRPASLAPLNQEMPVEKREQQTKTVSSWVIKGAIAAKNKNKSWTASLNWKQTGANNYQMRLFGPLGSGTVIVEKKGRTVYFKDGPKTTTSNKASELFYKETGIMLPVENLYYWVRGLPAPGSHSDKAYDRYNHLKTLRQSGYTVQYLSYTSKGSVDLPSKIKLKGHELYLKLVIKSWSV